MDTTNETDDEIVRRELRMIADLTRERDAYESAHAGLADECVRLRAELARELQAHCGSIDRAEKAERQRDELLEALKPFAPGFHGGVWGRIKAFIVNGSPTREEGIALARQVTEWQVAIPASVYVADGDRVPPFEGTDVMSGDEDRP